MSLTPRPSTPNIRVTTPPLQQSPDARRPHAIYPPQPSKAGDLANMSASDKNKRARIVSLTKSIDSVLDPAAEKKPAPPPNRPLAKLRPSWIGPQPSRRQKSDQMGQAPDSKHRVSIEFASPGLQPPVYVFTSLSEPQWEAVEMHVVRQLNGEYTFVRNFDVEEGEYQYKFRLGPGDWWVCDESKPTVDDGTGNRNNLIIAKAVQSPKQQSKQLVDEKKTTSSSQSSVKPPTILLPKPAKHAEPVMTPTSDAGHANAPLMQHEAFTSSDKGSRSEQVPEHERTDPVSDLSHKNLFQHEHVADSHKDTANDDEEAEPYNAPLMRHEIHEPHQSPLFRHESIGLDSAHPESAPSHHTNGSPVKRDLKTAPHHGPQEADPNDPSLEHFPTNHDDIMNHIHRTHTRLPEDETNDDTIAASPASSNAISEGSSLSMVPTLSSVDEEGDEQLERIREAEEQEVEDEEKNGEEVDPLKDGLPTPPPEPEDADFEPKVSTLKVVRSPAKEDKKTMVREKKNGLVDKIGQKNLMAMAVGLVAVLAGFAVVKLYK